MSWPKKSLSVVADFQLGKMLDQVKNQGDSRPYLANKNVRWGSFDLSELREMRFKESEFERFSLKNGDIVMCEGGEPGRCAIWRDELPKMMYQKALHRIRPFEGMDSVFLYYNLSHHARSGHFNGLFTGATIKHLPREKLALVQVDVPDLPTQQRIASVLSAYDDLIENNRRRIGLLEQAARLLYREWFVHFRFPGHETVAFVDGLPEGWCHCSVEDLLVLQRGFDLPVSDRKDGDVPVFGSTGIVGYHNEPKVSEPTIITGRSGSLGQVALSDVPCWPLNTALWVKELKEIPASLAYYLLVNLELAKYNGGASVPTLDRKVVHRLPATRPVPEIVDQFDAIASKSFQTVAKLKKHNLQLTRARDLLLPRLMDGRIPV